MILKFESIPKVGLFMEVEDVDGCVHSVMVRSITGYSDMDSHATETLLRAGSLFIKIGRPRTEILDGVRKAAADELGY